jgi:hypothetical protein
VPAIVTTYSGQPARQHILMLYESGELDGNTGTMPEQPGDDDGQPSAPGPGEILIRVQACGLTHSTPRPATTARRSCSRAAPAASAAWTLPAP